MTRALAELSAALLRAQRYDARMHEVHHEACVAAGLGDQVDSCILCWPAASLYVVASCTHVSAFHHGPPRPGPKGYLQLNFEFCYEKLLPAYMVCALLLPAAAQCKVIADCILAAVLLLA